MSEYYCVCITVKFIYYICIHSIIYVKLLYMCDIRSVILLYYNSYNTVISVNYYKCYYLQYFYKCVHIDISCINISIITLM